MSSGRDRIFGIDFSGSKRPGRSIWITEGKIQNKNLDIIDCQPASDRFNKSTRDDVYQELRNLVKSHPAAVFGFDFPFSLPEPIVNHVISWPQHLADLEKRLANKSAKEFRKNCVGRATVKSGQSGYLRRETDWRYGGQCPYQPQLQSQTFYGQKDLLRPLITNQEAKALPMQNRSNNHPWLIEVYPAATLSALGLYRQGYKNHPESSDRRAENINGLRSHGAQISKSVADKARKSDDAHDSITAAVATFRAYLDGFPVANRGADIEGQIFP
ncbi:DUF429 domain-containing protein [Haloarchaeobius litoreus]|uniref:DUF429 domain-containing protein n=1 Tax=Haloarchaeobius litoreus TaxID=755306 RepID=A0ABD6DEL1_9EURY